jgi:hypothetical protein
MGKTGIAVFFIPGPYSAGGAGARSRGELQSAQTPHYRARERLARSGIVLKKVKV